MSREILLAMLSYQRPHGSRSERAFCERFIESLPGVHQDACGNYLVDVGPAPRVLWSCHVDTVHRDEGRQRARLGRDGDARLDQRSNARCLGADDGAGVYVCRAMVLAGVPGRYVFHRGEERGGIGSAYIADHEPGTLDGIAAAVAFDRRGTSSIITHQAGGRCCSDSFAWSLAAAVGLPMAPDDGGSFTDTANYTTHVAECTNVSVGYEREHGPDESLNARWLVDVLTPAFCALDAAALDSLVIEREPGSYNGGWRLEDEWYYPYPASDDERLADLVEAHPDAAAALLRDYGISEDELREYIGGVS